MLETKKMDDLYQMDEMVSDYEFAERLYLNSISDSMADYYASENLIWADML